MTDQVKTDETASKKPKKFPVVIAAIVVVIVAVVVAMLVWHEQPSFCSAICHTPMDAYGATYSEGTADKYGNPAEANSMMAAVHAQEGIGCLDCHQPTMSQQINEGIAWVTGGYSIAGTAEDGTAYLPTRTLDELMAVTGKAGYEMCLNEACHNVALADLETLTADLSEVRNPHSTQHDVVLDCSSCHKAHGQSVNTCVKCHNDAPMPEGWLTPAQANKL